MGFSENEMRDYIFDVHKYNFSDLLIGQRSAVEWTGENYPPIKFFLQNLIENKINSILSRLEEMEIKGRELRLKKENDSTTRIDLYGELNGGGITIIELKKDKQTARQAFTELLGYANHFCSIFPGATEASIVSILVSPMDTRIVRDAYIQETLINKKNLIALIPKESQNGFFLEVYYPDLDAYTNFEDNIFNDASMLAVGIGIAEVKGWIDSDGAGSSINDHSKSALNTISSAIAYELESQNIHSFVYASQSWGEIAECFQYPNTIFIVAINPFSSYRTDFVEGQVRGVSESNRLGEVQNVLDQLEDNKFWLNSLEMGFGDVIIRVAKSEIKRCFLEVGGVSKIDHEISVPDWRGIKTSMIDSVLKHNLDVYPTGLIRQVYYSYIEHSYKQSFGEYFFSDDLPKYAYRSYRNFMAVWEVMSMIGHDPDEDEDEDEDENENEE